jgi:hypothetical protein
MTIQEKQKPIWETEGDEKQFEYKELQCFIWRHKLGCGHLCGYVEVKPNHPWYKQNYNYLDITVHGGITFGDTFHDGRFDGKWFLGFDCAHAGDLLPISRNSNIFRDLAIGFGADGGDYDAMRDGYETYKDMAFVEKEIHKLADQILKAVEV